MTEQEALDLFKHSNYMSDYSWQDDMAELAIKALEKQIPQLVANDGMRIPFSYYCPICKEELSDGGFKDDDIKYCPNCGQAVKWE